MEEVSTVPQSIESHTESAGIEAVSQLRRLAEPLRGLRVLHVNATPAGGGVAEILRSAVPLLRGLGLDASWQAMRGSPPFFATTKAIHNALQGDSRALTAEERAEYLACQQTNAARIGASYDIIVVHDPQPLGLLQAAGSRQARWIWRLHLDSSAPNPEVWALLRPMLEGYEAAVFTLDGFVPPDVDPTLARIIPPAIDPMTAKNRSLPRARALACLAALGLDPGRPLIAQIARLDPWKDPIGVIDAYRQVRAAVPSLQLALLGVISARDDPGAVGMAETVRAHAGDDADIHVFTDPAQVGMEEVGSVQQNADVVFQKSLREGFGLSVTEALWKATPVIGGHAGGIPLQLEDGYGGFLVSSVSGAAERTRWLLDHPPEARVIAARGRERVRDRFLITRLLADELRLYADVMRRQLPDEFTAAD